jgi:hypothetical protein
VFIGQGMSVELEPRFSVSTVMRRAVRPWIFFWGAVAVLGGLACAPPSNSAAADSPAVPPADIVNGSWQHHQVTFNYFGITSLYTCDGLEDQVRQILLHLGARNDAKVYASGCPGPYNAPSRTAWVKADFYTLVPATDGAGSGTVKANWTAVEVTPRRPTYMGDGDCELVQAMKDLIMKNFSLRNVEYRTSCVPHEVSLDAYAVKGQALKAVTPNLNAAKG